MPMPSIQGERLNGAVTGDLIETYVAVIGIHKDNPFFCGRCRGQRK